MTQPYKGLGQWWAEQKKAVAAAADEAANVDETKADDNPDRKDS